MRFQLKTVILLLLVTLVVVGCQEAQSGPEGGSLGVSGTISMYQLAQKLGLKVSDVTSTHYTLSNSSNTVMVFICTGGQVYVNTKPLGQTGTVYKKSSGIYVSESLVQMIRSALSSGYVPTPSYSKPSGCVVVDAGHGGKDPGAPSCLGYQEKTINLQVARKIASLLNDRGIKVVMTRNNDTFVELEDRAAVANRYRADLFVSIHADSAASSSAQGFTLYIAPNASWSSQSAAKAISRALSGVSSNGRGIQRNDYRVLIKTRGPAVLIELGYLSNRQEAALLRSSAYQSRLASAITTGIMNYLQ